MNHAKLSTRRAGYRKTPGGRWYLERNVANGMNEHRQRGRDWDERKQGRLWIGGLGESRKESSEGAQSHIRNILKRQYSMHLWDWEYDNQIERQHQGSPPTMTTTLPQLPVSPSTRSRIDHSPTPVLAHCRSLVDRVQLQE
uniref:Uncharacterized protein n=1 Tax=Moniliophthora roreri TaxID=221103 RepID=A0A0W0G0J2_MONRR